MLQPTENKSQLFEESSFEIIGGSHTPQTSIPAPVASMGLHLNLPSETETETGQTAIRHRRNKQTGVALPVPEENPNEEPRPQLETREKSESGSEFEPTTTTTASKIPTEENLRCDSKVKKGVEKELKKLKAKVKSLMEFKAHVQGRYKRDQSDQSDDDDDDEDESNTDQSAHAENDQSKNPNGQVHKTGEEKTAAKPWTIYDQFEDMIDCFRSIVRIQFGVCLLVIVLFIYALNYYFKVQEKSSITNTIYLYSEKNFEGEKKWVFYWDLNQNTCYNLDTSENDFASSIDTQEECLYIFKDPDCQGKKVKVRPETLFQHDLSLWGLDKAISSIQACYKHKG